MSKVQTDIKRNCRIVPDQGLSASLFSLNIVKKYYIDTIVRYLYRGTYFFNEAIEDCVVDEITVYHDIHTD